MSKFSLPAILVLWGFVWTGLKCLERVLWDVTNDNLTQNISVANENKCYMLVLSKIKSS